MAREETAISYLISNSYDVVVCRIVGKYTMTAQDVLSQRQFADVVAQACYQIDIHGPKDATFKIERLPPHTHYDIPYRCLVPQKVENLLVAGRCISATHEALGAVRVQPICMATGQAAGTAAALCAQHHTRPEYVSIAELQGKLSWTNESAHWIRLLYRLYRSRLQAEH